MIDLHIVEKGLRHNIRCAKEHGVILPTYAQMKDPAKIPSRSWTGWRSRVCGTWTR